MILEIWIKETDIEQLKKLKGSWLACKDKSNKEAIEYSTQHPPLYDVDWICVHISLDDYTILTDHELLIKY
jgi:hypothetical protein